MPGPEYAGPEWQAIRLQVLARDNHTCQIRGPKCRGRASHVDHIISVSQGGARLDPSNLQAACASCNVAKRNREVAARARGDALTTSQQWCQVHEQLLAQCAHLEPWSERWY
jgi:5-methylcytosine-specific restriction endonuclease McrA